MNYDDALKTTISNLPENYKQMINTYSTPMGNVETVKDTVKMYKKGGTCKPTKKMGAKPLKLAMGTVGKIKHEEADANGKPLKAQSVPRHLDKFYK